MTATCASPPAAATPAGTRAMRSTSAASSDRKRSERVRTEPMAASRPLIDRSSPRGWSKAGTSGPELELDAVRVFQRDEPAEVEHAHRRVVDAELVEVGDPAVQL